jgi:hypothetical protein
VEEHEDSDASSDSDPTPRKGDNTPTFSVIIESPKNRAKQRIRINEAGEAADVPDNGSEELWVGRGAVRLA